MIAGGIVFHSQASEPSLAKYNRAQAKLARFQDTMNLNILIDEYESDQLEAPNRKDVGNISNQSLMRVTQMRSIPFLLLTISSSPLD